MTPFELDILLHYYAQATEHPVVFENPPIWAETRNRLLDEGLLVKAPSDYGATYKTGARANVLIEHIINLPLPEWKMP